MKIDTPGIFYATSEWCANEEHHHCQMLRRCRGTCGVEEDPHFIRCFCECHGYLSEDLAW